MVQGGLKLQSSIWRWFLSPQWPASLAPKSELNTSSVDPDSYPGEMDTPMSHLRHSLLVWLPGIVVIRTHKGKAESISARFRCLTSYPLWASVRHFQKSRLYSSFHIQVLNRLWTFISLCTPKSSRDFQTFFSRSLKSKFWHWYLPPPERPLEWRQKWKA